jgi:hypothetical protein
MRSRLTTTAIRVLLATMLLSAGVGLKASAEPIPDEWCLKAPAITSNGWPFEGTLSNVPLQVPISVWLFTDNLETVCVGMTVVVQKADGSHRTVVPLDRDGGTTYPPTWTKYGILSAPVADGAGDWVVTKVTWGEKFLDVNVPFRVKRTSNLTLEQPVRTSGTARTTITGLARQYTSTGALGPSANRTIEIMHENGSRVTTAKSDAGGRYRATVAFTQNTTLRAVTQESPTAGQAWADFVTAHKLLSMSYLTAASNASVNTLWKVSGTAFPGKLWTALELWNGAAWVPAGSAGNTAANGSYARYWKPNKAGTFRLRVVVSGPRLDNSPFSREVTVTVRQLPQQPTYLTGTVAPTAGPPVRYETKMSSFGFLKIRRADGSIGPLANSKVEVLAKRPSDAGWYVAGSSTTSSSGYFYNNWYVGFRAGETFTAVLRYTTTLPQAASTTSSTFGPFTVQP